MIVAFHGNPVHRIIIDYLLYLSIFVAERCVRCVIISFGKYFFNYFCIFYIQCAVFTPNFFFQYPLVPDSTNLNPVCYYFYYLLLLFLFQWLNNTPKKNNK